MAGYTRFDRRTVEHWTKRGRYNERGKKVCLPAYEYSGRLRFKRGDVVGVGVGVLAPSAGGGRRKSWMAPARCCTRMPPPARMSSC